MSAAVGDKANHENRQAIEVVSKDDLAMQPAVRDHNSLWSKLTGVQLLDRLLY